MIIYVAFSVVFLLPRDAMRTRGGLCCRPVSPSVRLSDTFVYCIQTAEDVKLLPAGYHACLAIVSVTPSQKRCREKRTCLTELINISPKMTAH